MCSRMSIPNHNSRFELSGYSKRLYQSLSGRFSHTVRLRKLVKICRLLGGTRVLEIGCHDLLFYHLVSRDYNSYVGIDIGWEHGLEFAKKNMKEFGWDNVEVAKANAQCLPFKDQRFDLILCFETMEHLPDEAAAISEIARVIRPGGTLLLSVPVEFGLVLLLKNLVRFVLRREKEYTVSELVKASIFCNPCEISRSGHKGYHYRKTIEHLRDHEIGIQKIYTYPFGWLPDWLSIGVIILFGKASVPQKYG